MVMDYQSDGATVTVVRWFNVKSNKPPVPFCSCMPCPIKGKNTVKCFAYTIIVIKGKARWLNPLPPKANGLFCKLKNINLISIYDTPFESSWSENFIKHLNKWEGSYSFERNELKRQKEDLKNCFSSYIVGIPLNYSLLCSSQFTS